jgi:hypothetical protein
MRRGRERQCGHYLQIFASMNASSSAPAVRSHNHEQDGSTPLVDDDAAGHFPLDAEVRREQPIESDAVIDVEDELDPEGYGFGV